MSNYTTTIAITLGLSTILSNLPSVAQTSANTPIVVAQQSSSMTPEQMRQHHQTLITQMQQMLKQMAEQMEQMTPEEISQMNQQHQQMMSEMEELAGKIQQMHQMMGSNPTNNHHNQQ